MKQLYTILFCLIAIYTNGQITVTQSDISNVGDTVINANDTTVTGISIGNGGDNQTWDFSSLKNIYADTLVALNPASTPYGSAFPSSTFAVHQIGDMDGDGGTDSLYVYFQKTASNWNMLGLKGYFSFVGNSTTMVYDSPAVQITFPSTSNTGFSFTTNLNLLPTYMGDTIIMDVTAPTDSLMFVDSIRATISQTVSSQIDGWGNIQTPAGTFKALRQNKTTIEEMFQDGYIRMKIGIFPPIPLGWQANPFNPPPDTSVSYSYWANGQGSAVAEINTDASGKILSSQYLVNAKQNVGITEVNANESSFETFPNPASEQIHIRFNQNNSEALKLTVYNDLGQQIAEETGISSRTFVLNTSGAKNGIYYCTIRNKAGNILYRGKFIVMK